MILISPFPMISLSDVNLVSALVATIACMGIGFTWYHPAVFGTAWMKCVGFTEADCKNCDMKKAMGTGLLATFINVVFLSVLLQMVGTSTVKEAVHVAGILWLATALPGELHGVAWERRPMTLLYINAGNALVTYGVAAAIVQKMV